MKIPLPPWAPDVASNDAQATAVALNVFPRPDGYGPVPSPRAATQALPGPCRGAIAVRTAVGAWIVYAGTATKLYRLNLGTLDWSDVSGPSAYSLPEGDYWSFALYGPTLIATHTGARPQEINIDAAGAKFADLAYTTGNPPPYARFVAVVNEFVVFGGILGNEAAVQWSALGNPHEWIPGVHASDIQVLPDGGSVTGLVGGETVVIFQERAIQQLVFAPGTAEIFQRSKLESDRGAVAPWSVLKIGPTIFYLDRDGIYAFAAGVSVPIGKNRVNGWIQDLRDPTYIHTCVATPDPTGNRVLFAFKSNRVSDPTILDACIVYDYVQDRWTQVDLTIRHWLRVQTAPVSFDSINEDMDAGTAPYDFAGGVSADSAIFSGGVPLVGTFGLDNRLSLLEGPSLEALIETADAQLARPRRAYARGLRPDTDADSWTAAVGTRESLGSSVLVRWRSETKPNTQRFAPCHASGRYHRARLRIAAGDAWTYATAIEPDAVSEGSQ